MKINHLFIAVSCACLIMACSKNEDMENNGDPGMRETTEAYASVSIKLPSTKGTKIKARAKATDNPGKENEYKVNDVTIIFFRTPNGVSEINTAENAFIISDIVSTIPELNTRKGKLNLTLPDDGGGSPGSITKNFKTGAFQVDPSAVRAVAAINITGVVPIASSLLRVGNTFAQLNQAIELVDLLHVTGRDYNNFLMTSAPVWKNLKVTTLAVCQPQTSAQDAVDHPITMQVERVVAKVELKANDILYTDDGSGTKYFTIAGGSHNGDKINIEGWDVATTNQQSFAFRKAKDWSADYIGVWPTIINGTRIHWAEDPNYEGVNWPSNSFHNPNSIDIDRNWATGSKYCLENTCHFSNMNKSQTTRLIIRAKYIPNASNPVGGNNTTDPDDTWWSFSSVAAHYSIENLYVQAISRIHSSLGTSQVNDLPAIPADATAITVNADQMHGTDNKWTVDLEPISGFAQRFKLKSVTYVSTADGQTKALTPEQINNSFNHTAGYIQKYNQGICYYAVFIRHFTNGEGGYADDWNNAAGQYTPAQQGRFGTVRNNWYTVTVNSISNPGEPEIPDTPEVPVDEQIAYIDCDIQIAAWALRNQSEDL